QLAAQSAVMSEALVKAESNGDPNGIRTRVTAVKGRCPRPLDDRVTKPPNIPFDRRKATRSSFSATMQDRQPTGPCARTHRDALLKLPRHFLSVVNGLRDRPKDDRAPVRADHYCSLELRLSSPLAPWPGLQNSPCADQRLRERRQKLLRPDFALRELSDFSR